MMKSIDLIETYAYGTSKDLVSKKKRLNVKVQKHDTKMINFHDVTKEDINKHNPNWPQIPDHSYRILIIGGPRFGKQNHCLI